MFVLLPFHARNHKVKTQIFMRLHDGRIININETVRPWEQVETFHLTGCDTVSYPYGQGKITATNLLLKMNLIFGTDM